MKEAVTQLVALLKESLFIEKEIARRWNHNSYPRCYFMYAVILPEYSGDHCVYRAVLHAESKTVFFQCKDTHYNSTNFETVSYFKHHLTEVDKYNLFLAASATEKVEVIDKHIFGLQYTQDELKEKVLKIHFDKEKIYGKYGDPPKKYTKTKWETHIKQFLNLQ